MAKVGAINNYSKKMLSLLLIVFIFSVGHTTNYNATIDDKITEDISIKVTKGDIENPSNLIDTIITDKVYVYLNNENDSIYNKTVSKNGDNTNVRLKYTFDVDKFEKSKYFNTCFENTIFIKKDNYLYIKGYDGFYCSSGNNMNISITTDKLVMLHNASIVNGNTYTWQVNLKKYKDFVLEFQVDLTKSNSSKEKEKNKIISPFKIFIGIVLGITVIIIVVLIDKKKKEDF